LLRAYRDISDLPNVALLMVGDGKLLEQAKDYVRAEGLHNVRFTGFVNQGELPKYYGMSDVFIRPDGLYQGDWGLTVNEAMAAGLAMISSDRLGATQDLVKNNVNGRVIRFGDLSDLAAAMREMALDPERARAMGERSAAIIKQWSYEECVQAVKSALKRFSRREVREREAR
jgi:glycosyltransferase involved in cell wall biosynthesis